MIFKVLLPLMIGLFVYFLGKSHARREQYPPSSTPLKPALRERFQNSFRLVAIVLTGSALLSAAWFIYQDWHESNQTVMIRVINAQTGNASEYQALKGQVHGRVFTTTDGRQIRLADVERMEIY